ncbi:MAG: A/G-specific adenine glycosylase [Chlamydiales bacterium]|nr:A/G-specific adenine glycosylase [Chlamydiales bacterium]
MKEISQLHQWFEVNKRSFPWREKKNPYTVLVSEIMLQQTRANVVVPYFEKWMERFPNIETLAQASIEEVIKLWEGLGYYSRARRLHAAAKQIVCEFKGKIPNTKEQLMTIAGLGPYTVGAILNFGFHQRAPAVDGNVARVFARYFLIEQNIQTSSVKRQLEEFASRYADALQPWVTAEAWIELGASICGKKPQCSDCPLQQGCLGYQTNKAQYLPIISTPAAATFLFRSVFVIEAEGSVLLKKGAPGQLMGDLYEFPFVEKTKDWLPPSCLMKRLPLAIKHTFTKYIAHLTPYSVSFSCKQEAAAFLEACAVSSSFSYVWVDSNHLGQLPFSAGHRKILRYWREGAP